MEFEVLTGLSNAFLPADAVPFDHYLRRKTPSIAAVLQNHGYRTVAVHPFYDWFWNRNVVYPNLGFGEYISIKDFSPEDQKGLYVSDEALVDKIIKVVESSDSPYMIHVVSMQNHGPYFDGRYGNDKVNVKNNLPEWLINELGDYLTGLRDADRQLGRLLNYLSKRKEPIICLFFGDHQPGLSKTLYQELGISRKGLENDLLLYQVPGLLWSNRHDLIDTADIPERLSPAYLPAIVLHQMGIPLPPHMFYMRQGLSAHPVVHRKAIQDSKGLLKSFESYREDPFLRGLEILNFDVLFGSRFSDEIIDSVL
jgi:phosphoglycerol transferase MdoB-like AlkP superfamily enzyme